MTHIENVMYILLHIEQYLIPFLATHGLWTYVLVFAIIFAETGLIIMPFLPGDSLLFTLGSMSALPNSPFEVMFLFFLLSFASIVGNQLNYLFGRFIGLRLFSFKNARFFNKKHMDDAYQFYAKHGGKTIIMARFIPIIRTFVPFVAGVSAMKATSFFLYNMGSAILWIGSLLGMGYFLGSIPFIKSHFSFVIYSIVGLSLLPPIITFFYQRISCKAFSSL